MTQQANAAKKARIRTVDMTKIVATFNQQQEAIGILIQRVYALEQQVLRPHHFDHPLNQDARGAN